MSDNMKGSQFEKINSLIIKNDIVTAEKMIKRHNNLLTKSQKDKLQKEIIKQQMARQKCAFQAPKFSKFIVRWHKISRIKKLLVYLWVILGFVLFPYFKMEYFTLLSSWDGPPFQTNLFMEITFFVYIFLANLYFGFKVFENHWNRNIQREGMIRSKDTDKSSFDSFSALEKIYTKKERGWLAALLLSLFFLFIHLAYMVKTFSN